MSFISLDRGMQGNNGEWDSMGQSHAKFFAHIGPKHHGKTAGRGEKPGSQASGGGRSTDGGNSAGRGSRTLSRFSWIKQALLCNANLSSGLKVSQLGPQKRHPAPYACKQYEWIFHKHLRKRMEHCFNAHFQPKQDTHVDFNTCHYLQDVESDCAVVYLSFLTPKV